jgi:deoxyribonuclease-4
MPRSIAQEQDLETMPAPAARPPAGPRIGIHTSTSGGVETAAERAYRLGCSTFQVFSSSPRQWQPWRLSEAQCAEMRRLRVQHDLAPLVIHCNYLINLAGANPGFYEKSVQAFRGEVERALALGAEFLVLHPGSFRGLSREEGLERLAQGVARAVDGLDPAGVTLLIENTAGAEHSLGSSFEHVAGVVERLRSVLPVAACLDTCHTHVAGYDIVTREGLEETLRLADSTIGLKNVAVWHCNDAKAERGSRLDRHQHLGQGTIGAASFGRLLNDPRLSHAAFIAETPIDQPGDDRRNVEMLRSLVEEDSPRRRGDAKRKRIGKG